MAPRSRRAKASRKQVSPQQVPTCVFCDRPHSDTEIGGELLSTSGGFHAHYMCMLFSSGLHQRGEESDSLRGFVEADVRAELRRGSRLSCSFCKKKSATVGCCLKACKKVFHMPCGVANGCLLQFFGDFRVYCGAHRPHQNVVPMMNSDSMVCSICAEEMVHPSMSVLVTPCCRQLFHRACIQRQAMSAGSHFFRCGHCNNQEAFQREMQEHGIYVPEQDASWEREPHAFEDLLFRYKHCDAPHCRCPSGREYHRDTGRWRIVVCNGCGSQGVHSSCGNKPGMHWLCADCRQVVARRERPTLQRATTRREALKEPTGPVEVIEIDSDDDDDNVPRQNTTLMSTPPNSCRFLDFAMCGGNCTVDGTLHLTLETMSGSVIVAVVGEDPNV